MTPVEYRFPWMISGSFEIPTEDARRLTPKGVEPVEAWHGTSVLTVTLFEFDRSPIGPYQEVVLSVFAVPRLLHGDVFPHAAVAPLRLGSTHAEARQHAIDLWSLPHFHEDIKIDFAQDGAQMTGRVYCPRGDEILSLTVSHSGAWRTMEHRYQSFQAVGPNLYMGQIDWIGELSDHEEGTGSVQLNEHLFFDDLLDPRTIDSPPLREMWMRNGVEIYLPALTCIH